MLSFLCIIGGIVLNAIGASLNSVKLCIFYGWYFTQCVVEPMIVIILHPNLCLVPYLNVIREYVFIKDPSSVASIEPFYKSILGGFSRLDMFELYPVHLALIVGYVCYEFWAVVHSDLLWCSFFIDYMVQDPHFAVVGQ